MKKIDKKQLETLAQEFYKTKLWELLSDSDIYAVQLEDGRIAYCCIMGNAGDHIGLGVYIGTRGFRTYLDSVTLDVSKDHKLGFERIANFNCVQLAFNENGNADFYAHRTHKMPEPDNCTPKDFEVLHQALVATISLAKFIKIAGDDVVAIGFDEYEEYPTKEGGKEAILMKHEGNGYICDTIKLPAYDTCEEKELEKMAAEATESIVNMPAFFTTEDLRKSGTVQCRWIHYPTPLKDNDDEEGYFAESLLAVTKGNGQILKPELIKTRNTKEIQNVLINLCKEFDNLGHCPLQISVPDLATESVLKAFCKALKIKLVKERLPLRELNDAWEYLHNYTMDM